MRACVQEYAAWLRADFAGLDQKRAEEEAAEAAGMADALHGATTTEP